MPEAWRIPILEEQLNKDYCLLTKSATVAIWLILKALSFQDRMIIVPANTCFVVTCAILLSGNRPYYVDIDESCSIDPALLDNINDKKVAAILYPYMYGNTGNIARIYQIAASKGWILIEDIAQALGAKIDNRYVGSFSDIAIASFGGGKIIERKIGGALCVNARYDCEYIRHLYEGLERYNNRLEAAFLETDSVFQDMVAKAKRGVPFMPFTTSDILVRKNAFLQKHRFEDNYLRELTEQLACLDSNTDIRVKNAHFFQEILHHDHVEVVRHRAGATYWRQNILVDKNRDGLWDYLKTRSIKASSYFPPANRFFTFQNNSCFPNTESFYSRVINLWPYVETSEGDIVRINAAICDFFRSGM
jgi:dTDP-4-amino-4,6-dideoxygalactose transaminase